MSDLIEAIAKALGPYPLIQIVAVLSFGSFGAYAWWRGERDRKAAAAPPSSPIQVPLFLLIDPVRSVFDAVHNISEATRQANERTARLIELMSEQKEEHRAQRELLERIERKMDERHRS